MQEVFEKTLERLEEELELADKEKERCVKENHLQFDSAKGYANGVAIAIEIVKQEAEKYDNGWIPCSERLPEKYNRVLAHTDAGEYYIAHVNGCGKFVCTAECVSTVIENSDVIAWQPLPAPYQPHQREEKE